MKTLRSLKWGEIYISNPIKWTENNEPIYSGRETEGVAVDDLCQAAIEWIRENKKTILNPNTHLDVKIGLDYVNGWISQFFGIIEEELV